VPKRFLGFWHSKCVLVCDMAICTLNPLQDALKWGVHSDYSVHNIQSVFYPDARIGASFTCRSRKGRPDVPLSAMLDGVNDLQMWVRSLWYLLNAIEKHRAV